jgi:hypothetical protein
VELHTTRAVRLVLNGSTRPCAETARVRLFQPAVGRRLACETAAGSPLRERSLGDLDARAFVALPHRVAWPVQSRSGTAVQINAAVREGEAMKPSILQRIFQRTTQSSSARSRARWKATAAAIALALGATSAAAAIVSVVPDVVYFEPASVVVDETESDLRLIAFNERQCVVLPVDVSTDDEVIRAGTRVSSHLIHGDPITDFTLTGRVRFQSNILGVISTRAQLDATDCPLGKPGVAYPNCPLPGDPPPAPEPLRGLEPADGYMIGGAGRGIEVTMQTGVASDQIRVLTACP